ncbi:PASTA domain-containing protein [Herbidospora mongoliensis]|uniref:PASTA domain-containing protein n=1 Tax=Herbidospora mongoliensis TaxID=688067 RepID=UPI000829B822|nr:PASTA domain-containing protein [Herbidospora mongoliensis]
MNDTAPPLRERDRSSVIMGIVLATLILGGGGSVLIGSVDTYYANRADARELLVKKGGTLPDVTGTTWAEAVERLQRSGYWLLDRTDVTMADESRYVTRQDPPAGTTVPFSTRITLITDN